MTNSMQAGSSLHLDFAAVKDGARLSSTSVASKRLESELEFLKREGGVDVRVRAELMKAADCYRKENYQDGAEIALRALDIDDRIAVGWNILGLCLEKMGQNARAISCFEKVLQLEPQNVDVLLNLGLLAARLELHDTAEQFLRYYCAAAPENTDGVNNLATVLRDKGKYAEASEILKAAIFLNPDDPTLWNSMGTIMNDLADFEHALTFYSEAIRLKPDFARAYYNRGNILIFTGPLDQAREDFAQAVKNPASADDEVHMRYALGQTMVASGALETAWQAYDARLDTRYPGTARFAMPKPQWQQGESLKGKRLLLVGEQGLGDEILFMNAGHDLIKELGPEGNLYIACERRLVPLFERSFPDAEVGPHMTISDNGKPVRLVPFMAARLEEYDVWAPMASVLSVVRNDLCKFPADPAFLKADPERVSHWREQLKAFGPGPYVGLTWKSMKADPRRARFYMPTEAWGPILDHGVTYISLQYGDDTDDIADFKAQFGVDIHKLSGIDLRNDLDDLAALCSAMDLMIGPMNATTNIGMACGTPACIMSGSRWAWPLLGTQSRLPWYPNAEVFAPQTSYAWGEVAQDISGYLGRMGKTERPKSRKKSA